MHKRKHVLAMAVVMTAIAAGTAMAGPLAPVGSSPVVGLKPAPPATKFQKVTWSCPPMIQGSVSTVETDWQLMIPQGWLDRAEIGTVGAPPFLRCYYGVDKNNPAARPAYYINRTIPSHFTKCAIDAPANTSMTCTVP